MAIGDFQKCDWSSVLSIALLDEIEGRLEAGILALKPGLHRSEYAPGSEGLLLQIAKGVKTCEWQRPTEPRGKLCAATAGQPEPTTTPLCATCEMPDSRLVCSALVHPVTKLNPGIGCYVDEPIVTDPSRNIEDAFCEMHLQLQSWAECRPWSGKECWHRVVMTGLPVPAPDDLAPRRAVDEIGYLRLVYADRFGLTKRAAAAFWPRSDESAVNALRDECHSLPEFKTHVVALCEILLAMKPHDQLPVDKRTGDDKRPVNGITALGRVLEDRFGGAGLTGMAYLRALNTARNRFSHAESKELVDALRVLGVTTYPPRSWQIAWWQVAASVAEGLADVRASMQSSPPSEA